MHMIKCKLGHIYDSDKFRSCPHCYTAGMTLDDEADMLGEYQEDKETEQPGVIEQKNYRVLVRRKAVGMLICVKGEMRGDAFILREGDNIIGRNSNMDVALTQEESISRSGHAAIRFEEDCSFVLKYSGNRNDVSVNGSKAVDGARLSDRDIIRLGSCELMLIGAGDIWEKGK